MKIGTISKSAYALTDQQNNDWTIHSFTLSTSALSFSEIPDSAFSTPARYVQEIFFRLCLLEELGQEAPKFIFNPLFETNRLNILLVLGSLREVANSQDIAVLVDVNNLPVGYFFPAWLPRIDGHFLSMLSTMNGETDAEWLRRAFFTEARCIRVKHLRLNRVAHNDFFYEGTNRVYQWVTRRAIAVLKANLPDRPIKKVDIDHCRQQRNAIPFTAVMPYHAGDVLFFSIAFNNIKTHFSRIVVSRTYLDIVSDNAPLLTPVPIDVPPIHRDGKLRQGNVTPDHTYFETFQDTLPEDSFYYYCRPSRSYYVTQFNLIDHFAFALGYRAYTGTELLLKSKPSPGLYQPNIPATPIRVLLHFDGGWALKIYPKKSQEQLIDLLYASGYAITILTATEYAHPKCHVTTFRSYAQFTELLKNHHILVGMDSFPCHYSAHILGLPTICLFSNTRPENSNALRTVNYIDLEAGLHCRPCNAIAECPRYGKDYCENFVKPEVVFDAINAMIFSARNEKAAQLPDTLRQSVSEPIAPPPLLEQRGSTEQISMAHLDMKILLAGSLLPHFRYSSTLYREFSAAVKREGIRSAVRRVIRFILRQFRTGAERSM